MPGALPASRPTGSAWPGVQAPPGATAARYPTPPRPPLPRIMPAVVSSLSSMYSRSDFCPGTTAVTGSPRRSIWRMRSRRSHFERFLGSVETMISSKSPSWIARSTASKRVRPADEAFHLASCRALKQRDRGLQRPVRCLAVGSVGDQQGEGGRPGPSAALDFLEEPRGGCRSVRHDKDASGL